MQKYRLHRLTESPRKSAQYGLQDSATYLHHDVVARSSLLGFIDPPFDHIVTDLHHVLGAEAKNEQDKQSHNSDFY